MALTPCAPCNCIPGIIGKEKFMQDMEIILCGILTAIQGGGAVTSDVNLLGVNGIAPAVGNGATNTGTLRVTLSNDSTGVVTVANGGGVAAVNIQDGGNAITVDGTVAATQSGTWNIGTLTTLTSITNPVTVTGTVAATQSGTWNIGTVATITNPVTITGTATVSGTVAATQSGAWVLSANSGVDIGDVTVNNAAGAAAVNIQDGGNTITVDGTVAATQSGTWILGANSGVDIGDVTVNNAAGAAAVNIQDGGNTITVDGTVAATQSGTWNIGTITTITGPVPVTQASASVASGAYSSGSIASGAIASGAIASGAIASGAVASGAFAAGSIAAGAIAAGALSFVKLEDVASAGGDAGVPAMAIQVAAPGDTAADSDYSMLQMKSGRLYTSSMVQGSAGNSIDSTTGTPSTSSQGLIVRVAPGNGANDLGKAEDAAHGSGDLGIAVWGVANIALATFGADGDYTPQATDRLGRTLVTQKSAATLANVASSATSVTLQAANTARTGWSVQNDSTAILYVKFGATASATSYTVQMPAGSYYEAPFGYTGIIDGIWASANGNARVTEFT